jgi:hypothetical protein
MALAFGIIALYLSMLEKTAESAAAGVASDDRNYLRRGQSHSTDRSSRRILQSSSNPFDLLTIKNNIKAPFTGMGALTANSTGPVFLAPSDEDPDSISDLMSQPPRRTNTTGTNSRCPVPDTSNVRCAFSPPVLCLNETNGLTCPYDILCYGVLAGFSTSDCRTVSEAPSLSPSSSVVADEGQLVDERDDAIEGCPVPDISLVRCAYSPPVMCVRRGLICPYDVMCYALVAGFIETQCQYADALRTSEGAPTKTTESIANNNIDGETVEEGRLAANGKEPDGSSPLPPNDARCPVPDMSNVRCAFSHPVVCVGTNGLSCSYEVKCYAMVAGFEPEQCSEL